ncbi:hypothetical protein DMH18_04060 [Streptomyces sp. WAC 06783]|nr:hypothetical protein DMH18_04060 [Streptomyces sp. WAC 06783]
MGEIVGGGVLRRDRRQVIGAIACKSRTGSRWVHLLERYGSRRGVHNPNSPASAR